MEELKDLYKVRVGYHGVEPEKEWYQNYSSAPTWCAEKVGGELHVGFVSVVLLLRYLLFFCCSGSSTF